jgi:hypothetical protein
MLHQCIDNDSLQYIFSYLPTSVLLKSAVFVCKQWYILIVQNGPSCVWHDRMISLSASSTIVGDLPLELQQRFFGLIARVHSNKFSIENAKWLVPVFKYIEKLRHGNMHLVLSPSIVDNLGQLPSFKELEEKFHGKFDRLNSLHTHSSRLLHFLLNRTESCQSIHFAADHNEQFIENSQYAFVFPAILDLILKQSDLRELYIGKWTLWRVDDEKIVSFLSQLFHKQQSQLERFSIESIQMARFSSDKWIELLQNVSLSRLKHLNIVTSPHNRTIFPLDTLARSLPAVESLSIESASIPFVSTLLDATRNTLQSFKWIQNSYNQNEMCLSTLYFPRLKNLKLTAVNIETVIKILSNSPVLEYIEIVLNRIQKHKQNIIPYEFNMPHLQSVSIQNAPIHFVNAILANIYNHCHRIKRLSIELHPEVSPAYVEQTQEMWSNWLSKIVSLNHFEGELGLFECLPRRVLSTLQSLKVKKKMLSQLLDKSDKPNRKVLDENLIHRLMACSNIQILHLTDLDYIADCLYKNNCLYQLIGSLPHLKSFELYPRFKHMNHLKYCERNLKELYNLQHLCYDFSDLSIEELDQLLEQFPNLHTLKGPSPISTTSSVYEQSLSKFFGIISLLNRQNNRIDTLEMTIGTATTSSIKTIERGIWLNKRMKLVKLNLLSTIPFEDQMLICMCTKYDNTYYEASSTIDIVRLHNEMSDRDEIIAESRSYYEDLALDMINDIIERIDGLNFEQQLKMKQNVEERGLPPCIKALIDLYAPVIC